MRHCSALLIVTRLKSCYCLLFLLRPPRRESNWTEVLISLATAGGSLDSESSWFSQILLGLWLVAVHEHLKQASESTRVTAVGTILTRNSTDIQVSVKIFRCIMVLTAPRQLSNSMWKLVFTWGFKLRLSCPESGTPYTLSLLIIWLEALPVHEIKHFLR